MARISLMQICDGIAATFDGENVTLNVGQPATTIIAQSYDELTEGQQDTPTLQVFPASSEVDVATATDRTTFGACVRQGAYVFTVRGFARPRSHLGEDMEATVRLWDLCEEILETVGQDCALPRSGSCTMFGVAGIKSFEWTVAVPRVWNYGNVDYVGFEMTITVRVF